MTFPTICFKSSRKYSKQSSRGYIHLKKRTEKQRYLILLYTSILLISFLYCGCKSHAIRIKIVKTSLVVKSSPLSPMFSRLVDGCRCDAMPIKFEILYDENPHGLYFTGQVVLGKGIIHLDEAIPIKGIELRVRGYANVRWDETISTSNSDGTTSTTTDTHSDEIIYFDTVTKCVDTEGKEINLEPGTYTFNFECPIPLNCPTSFEGTYGNIRYESKITIKRPRKFNKSYSMGFSVVNIVDLNNFPNLRIPAKMEIFKTFCCGPCKSRPLVLSIDIPRTSYVPGEFIDINARLVNHSSIKVEKVRVALNLKVHYSARHRVSTKSEKIAVAKNKFEGFENSVYELRDKLQVPPTPPTCEDLCEIIKLTYEVELIAKVKGAHISPIVSIPVTIGNIPFVARSAHISEDLLIANLWNGAYPDRHRANKNSTDGDVELPPPSYEEAMFVQAGSAIVPKKDDENTDTKFATYSPRYPFYSVQFPTAATQEK